MIDFRLVRRRRRQYEAAAAAYRAAILDALEHGASYADVARALGVSRQSVRQMAGRTRASFSVEEMTKVMGHKPIDPPSAYTPS